MRSRPVGFLLSALAGAALAFGGTAAASATPPSAPGSAPTGNVGTADACYTWGGNLQEGSSGEAVRQLQIRVAGYPGTGNQIAIDGVFGPATKAAVARFQSAYGLAADGTFTPRRSARSTRCRTTTAPRSTSPTPS